MQLHYQRSGQGEPLVILHGLFGTLENWGGQIKAFAEHYDVIAVDLRNHGRSPHTDQISYELMAADIIDLLDQLELPNAHILGHSMGGKVAMQLALNTPDRVNQLIIVDIAPVAYQHDHDDVFKGLFNVQLDSITSRKEAESQLAEHVQDPSVRAFLLKNLYRNDDKRFAWRMNLELLHRDYDKVIAAPQGSPFNRPALFIKGSESHYLLKAYQPAIMALFPAARLKMIEGAGHWPHAEKPALFTRLVLNHLQSTE
ncbi:alpha/beta fold hydrolase [Nitrincola sp. MINF-07-Sa-05]|uniref:alpha/beta fold hydrolase n=1 Tax=Nitrincola salilacus TaxID=3400273 RepID=UPI003917EB40